MKKLEQAKMKNVFIDLASFVITVNEDYTTNREQKLNYPLLTLVSDIGGAAGLIAGVSLALICGLCDLVVTLCFRHIRNGGYGPLSTWYSCSLISNES